MCGILSVEDPAHVRERKCCPECGSLRVHRRKTKDDYLCELCGWTGTSVSTTKSWVVPRATTKEVNDRLENLRKIHEEHPEYTQKELRIVSYETAYMVAKYFKMIRSGSVNTSDHSCRNSSIHSVSKGFNSQS